MEAKSKKDLAIIKKKNQEAVTSFKQAVVFISLIWTIFSWSISQNELSHLNISAKDGNIVDQYRLGMFYAYGNAYLEYFETDIGRIDVTNMPLTIIYTKQTIKWLEKSAKAGFISARYQLALIYCCKISARMKNYTLALQWFKAAGSYGHAQSQYNAGVIYLKGAGLGKDLIKKNKNQAIYWLTKASKNGAQKAQFLLSRALYSEGKYIEASKWLNKAKQNGVGAEN